MQQTSQLFPNYVEKKGPTFLLYITFPIRTTFLVYKHIKTNEVEMQLHTSSYSKRGNHPCPPSTKLTLTPTRVGRLSTHSNTTNQWMLLALKINIL